jgi:hypothetical protein
LHNQLRETERLNLIFKQKSSFSREKQKVKITEELKKEVKLKVKRHEQNIMEKKKERKVTRLKELLDTEVEDLNMLGKMMESKKVVDKAEQQREEEERKERVKESAIRDNKPVGKNNLILDMAILTDLVIPIKQKKKVV